MFNNQNYNNEGNNEEINVNDSRLQNVVASSETGWIPPMLQVAAIRWTSRGIRSNLPWIGNRKCDIVLGSEFCSIWLIRNAFTFAESVKLPTVVTQSLKLYIGIGLYISDNFDQTVDLTEEYSAYENIQSHHVRTRMVPVHTFRTPKPTAVLSNGFSSLQIMARDKVLSHDLIQINSNADGTQSEKEEYHAVIVHEPEAKIPRPPNAFMIFANEWRKKVAHKFNNESNKDISVRLGQMWRSLDKTRKEEYFVMARKADAEHKMKYPDYVYNPKEARLRKALRDSWKDKGKHTFHDSIRFVGKSNTENWSSPQNASNRKLLAMPSVSDMTFSMAADGYSMMETPAWSNSWYSYRHNSVPYLVPPMSETYPEDPNSNYSDRMYHQNVSTPQSEVRASIVNQGRSPFANTSEPETSKEPLSQLQELANVFSSPAPCNRNGENDIRDFSPSKPADVKFTNNIQIKTELESSVNHDSDSGYVTDHPRQPEGRAMENGFGKNGNKTGVSDVLMTENDREPFMEAFENNGQGNYINVDDVFLGCNFLSGEKNFGSNTSLDIVDQGKNVLPGFQQAFGSTEIGRFSRNDFFTNPPAETPEKTAAKISKTEPHPWNPNPAPPNFTAPTTDADFFTELCDIEESLLQTQPILSDPDCPNQEGKKLKKQKTQVHLQKKRNPGSSAETGPTHSDELFDALSTVIDEIDDFDVDELLLVGSNSFNLCEATPRK